ncbi:Proline-rich protein PRCC [Armadillidium nasatum]|uniref:Proline-rich protein PRCC n=1 Tax=Armadillidium nasatum TaxID=96803 RepID=A0A5N5T324_9CRUS|nr:Proline-rich protein PRCC [Armadillidium nasatum]
MALVAYSDESDISDSDEESLTISRENLNSNSNVKAETHSTAVQNGTVRSVIEAEETSIIPEVADDDVVNDVPTVQTWNVIKNKEPSSSIGQIFKNDSKSKKLKLVLPALSEFDDDDEEEQCVEEIKRKKIEPSSRGTGLFAVLPKPKSGGSATSLVPLHVSKKMANKPEKVKKVMKGKPPELPSNKCNDSDEEWDSSTTNDFFSLDKSNSPPPLDSKIEIEINVKPRVDISPKPRVDISQEVSVPSISENECKPAVSDQPALVNVDDSATYDSNKSEIDAQALSRLAGRRNRGEIPNIIDINADDALMSRDEWVTRALCDEKPKTSFSRKKEGIPSQQQRRKHQITYLAHQAKEREQELQNAWGQNRFTKMQTQSKYGF